MATRRRARTLALGVAAILVAGLSGLTVMSASADDTSPTIVDLPSTIDPAMIAIDGDTVVTAGSDTVDAQTVDFDASTVSDATQLGTGVGVPCSNDYDDDYVASPLRCSGLAVSNGEAAWSNGFGPTAQASVSNTAGTSESTVTYSTDPGTAYTTAVSGKWVLLGDREVLDSTTSDLTSESDYIGADLLDSVAYVPGANQQTTPGSVLERDLDTGTSAQIAVPGCLYVEQVQVAGSWMLVTCELPDQSQTYVLVDRTGAVPNQDIPITGNYILLGNGFLAEVTSDGSLNWTPIGGDTLDWTNIATVSTIYNDFAVSRGSIPSLAWIDSDGAHAAVLPVTASAAPAAPTSGQGIPAAPGLAAEGWSDHVDLSWPTPPTGEALTGYILYDGVAGPGGLPTPVILPPTAQSYTIPDLTFEESGSAELYAENANGTSSGSRVSWEQEEPYPWQPTNFVATIDPVTGAITATWDWNQFANADPLESFTVVAGQYSANDLSASTRSVTIQPGLVFPSSITLMANGPRQSSSVTEPLTKPAGYFDPTPAVAVTVPTVSPGDSIDATITATQGEASLPMNVRYRNADSTRWLQPESLQDVTGTQQLDFTGLSADTAYCFSVQAQDVDGNETAWTTTACSTVPRDDRSLTRTGSWKLLSGPQYLDDTASESVNTSSALSASIEASKIWVVATTCPTCGDLGFRVGTTTMWVSLYSPTTVASAVVYVPWSINIDGKVSLVQRYSHEPVVVDGLAYLPLPAVTTIQPAVYLHGEFWTAPTRAAVR